MSAFSKLIAVASLPPINVGLHSATEQTMISILGRPAGDIDSKNCKNQFASETVKRLQLTKSVGPFKATGLSPAVDSLERSLTRFGTKSLICLARSGMLECSA